MSGMERTTVSLPKEYRDRLKSLAKRTDRSEAWLIRQAVRGLIEADKDDGKQLELDLKRIEDE